MHPRLIALSRFIERNSVELATVCFLATFFIFRYQAELDPLPLDAVAFEDIQALGIGMLEISVLGRNEHVTVAKRDAGYAIEYVPQRPTVESASTGPKRAFFSPELTLSEAEVRWIRGQGPLYRVGMAHDEIVTVESNTQTLIPYDRYIQRAARKRDLWRAVGILVFAFGVLSFALRLRRKRDA
jgi:hypothetical protein